MNSIYNTIAFIRIVIRITTYVPLWDIVDILRGEQKFVVLKDGRHYEIGKGGRKMAVFMVLNGVLTQGHRARSICR